MLLDLEECIRAYDTVNLMSIHNVHPTWVGDVVLKLEMETAVILPNPGQPITISLDKTAILPLEGA